MEEVIRFRVARAPQRVVPAPDTKLTVTEGARLQEWLGSEILAVFADEYINEIGVASPARKFSHPDPNIAANLDGVRWLDELLMLRDNRVAWKDIADLVRGRLDGDPAAIVERWAPLRDALSLTLVAATVTNVTPSLRSDVIRLLLVIGLLELVAERQDLDADEVFNALRWRAVVLPPRLLSAVPSRSLLARQPGVADLYVVREEWARYEVGEIAHIENVLKGEVKESLLERTDEREATTSIDQEINRLEERDTQSTDRFELKQEAERETALAFHIDGKVDVAAQYGPFVKINVNVGTSFDYSVEEAESRAVTQARETIARAINRIQERVREQRTTRTLTRVHSADKHLLDNKDGTNNVSGIYRWVDKIKTVQVFKYPHRLLFEFEVPEPGAFLRWLNTQPTKGAGEPVVHFTLDGKETGTPLTPDLITADASGNGKINYLELAQRYAVQGVAGPPPERMVFASLTNSTPEKDVQDAGPPVFVTANTSVPDGYEGYKFTIYGVASSSLISGRQNPSTGNFEIAVGTDFPSSQATDNDPGTIWRFSPPLPNDSVFRGLRTMNFRAPVSGPIPILLVTDNTSGLLASVQIFCRPTASKVQEWRFATFDLIQGAYWELRRQQEQNAAQANLRAGIAIAGDSPTRNAEVMREELKRALVEMLTGSRFNGRPAMTQATDTQPARIDFPAATATAAEIQFLEQSFEWENMSYMLYPYFWADVAKWAELQGIESADPDFDRFLRSGSARVVLPARPGFEFPAQIYTLFGTLWGGGPAPVPGDELYLSIANEVRALQQPPKDGVPGEWWEVRLPTTLVYLSPLNTTLPLVNDGAELPEK